MQKVGHAFSRTGGFCLEKLSFIVLGPQGQIPLVPPAPPIPDLAKMNLAVGIVVVKEMGLVFFAANQFPLGNNTVSVLGADN